MLKERLRKDNRGLTLIELICAVAILSVITATVGGAMVVATNTYRSGTVETSIQQETQFTANAIESLIIDATNTVDYSGDVLTINNTDYTYTIVYDSTAKTLRYSQYDVVNGTYLATNELLAENVSEFNVDASDFATTRNARLTLGMERDGKTFKTNYNVTSRNDANAGTPIAASAIINTLEEVTLEPCQVYDLDVSVVSTTGNTNYTVAFEPEEDGTIAASFVKIPTGLRISIGATENGGTDGMLRLLLTTAATDGSGNALQSKIVKIYIRRINEIPFSTLTLESGTSLKDGAVYSLGATPTGTNLARVPLAEYDNDYVDPNTLQWSFEVPSGSTVASYVTVLSGTQENEVRFQLKKNLAAGDYVKIVATALHPEGKYLSETVGAEIASNKTRQDYGDVKNSLTLMPDSPWDDAILRRSIETNVTANFNYSDLVKRDWEKNHPGQSFDESQNGYHGGYAGNVYYRYYSASGHKSTGYDEGKWLVFVNQGQTENYLKFDSAVFEGMKIMEDYTLEVLYSFWYNDRSNTRRVFPIGADTEDGRKNIDPQYIHQFDMKAMGVRFDWAKDYQGSIDLSSYLTDGGKGIGTKSNPLPVQKGSWLELHHHLLGGVANSRSEITSLVGSKMVFVSNDGNNWEAKNPGNINYSQGNVGLDTGTFYVDQNFYNNSNRSRYMAIVFKTVHNNYYNIDEEYAEAQGLEDIKNGVSGRGVVYLEFVDK